MPTPFPAAYPRYALPESLALTENHRLHNRMFTWMEVRVFVYYTKKPLFFQVSAEFLRLGKPVAPTGEKPITISLNPDYLADPLRVLACDDFVIKYNNGFTPVEIRFRGAPCGFHPRCAHS